MRKAAMPVPYIIALIIGVIVVVVLVYWFVSSGSRGADVGKGTECTARKVEFCTTQSQDALDKANEVCIRIDKKTRTISDAYWCDFCKFIPNWKLVSGEKCPTQPQP